MKRRGEDVLASVGVRIAVSEVGARSILKYVKCKELTPRAPRAHAPTRPTRTRPTRTTRTLAEEINSDRGVSTNRIESPQRLKEVAITRVSKRRGDDLFPKNDTDHAGVLASRASDGSSDLQETVLC